VEEEPSEAKPVMVVLVTRNREEMGAYRGTRAGRRLLLAVIGSGDAQPGDQIYREALAVGTFGVAAGFRIQTGGLHGVMEAAHKGARESSAYRDGDTVALLPGADPDAANRYADIVIPTGLGRARNTLVAAADAVIAVGGGAGTLSEICFAWMRERPIVAIEVDGWSGRVANLSLDDRRKEESPISRIRGARDGATAVRLVSDLVSR